MIFQEESFELGGQEFKSLRAQSDSLLVKRLLHHAVAAFHTLGPLAGKWSES